MNKKSAHEATSLPGPMADEATVDPAARLPDFPAEPLDVPAAKPKRVRKPRTKAAEPPVEGSGRPILHLKSSTPRRRTPETPVDAAVSAPGAAETFQLTGASDSLAPAEQAVPQQIEIPELPLSSAENTDPAPQNGALQEVIVPPPPIATPLKDTSFADRPLQTERAGANGSLANGNLQAEPQIETGAFDPPVQVPATAEADEQHEVADTAPQPENTHRETEPAPPPGAFDDPRFTYVPRWRSESFPDGQSEQDVDDRPLPAVADPEPQEAREPEAAEAREQEQVVPETAVPTTARSEPRWRISALALRTQLILIALAPIFVGGVIAFLTAFLSPTLFAARSEIVVNVTTMDWSSAERFLATQLVVVKARSTLEPIAQATGIPLRDLEKDIKAELIGSSDVISIQYANSDASLALDVVKAVTAQYLINLRDYEQVGNGRHRVLMPATVLDEPVSLKPLYAALIGAIVGFAIGVLGIVLRTQLWRLK